MELTRLGRTELMVTRTSFGVLPIQRTEKEEASRILNRAFDAGINFYDTARAYSDSEEKIGYALSSKRDQIIIASKSGMTNRKGIEEELETSLRNLKTDYIDILQLHNPKELPNPDDPDSSYAALVDARAAGKIRHIGITNHSRERAIEAVESGLYDTLQFPLCMISDQEDWDIAEKARQTDMGVIAMKGLCGGLITNARAAFAFMRQFACTVPIWGIQHMHELEEFIELEENPPALDEELQAAVAKDKAELAGNFCRACGYCLPCPADIPIPMAARMGLCIKRMPYQQFLSDAWQERMSRIDDCIECGACSERCPYGLDPAQLLKEMKRQYDEFLAKHS